MKFTVDCSYEDIEFTVNATYTPARPARFSTWDGGDPPEPEEVEFDVNEFASLEAVVEAGVSLAEFNEMMISETMTYAEFVGREVAKLGDKVCSRITEVANEPNFDYDEDER